MNTTRRQFLQATLGSSAFAAMGLAGCASTKGRRGRAQDILILGGTSFLGPALIEAALARGHSLTLFNSGRTESRRQELGRPSVVPDGVESLIGNRDPLLTADDRRFAGDPDIESKLDPNSPRGLTQLEGRRWDAVIDTSGFFPRMVRSSAELLAPNTEQYVYISSISVYPKLDIIGLDENAQVATLEDPTVEEFGENFVNYGGGKAMCEAAAEAALPGRTTNIRPGYIVGARDTSRRFIYWPWRVAEGGEMIVPGTPADPIQIIDVRDLAEWIVLCIENRTMGVFNATGPAEELSMQRMLEGCRSAAGSDTSFTWVDPDFMEQEAFFLPIWAAPDGENAGIHRVDVTKAVDAGLRFRSIEDTARTTLDWRASLPEELQDRVLPEVSLETEAELLRRWKERA